MQSELTLVIIGLLLVWRAWGYFQQYQDRIDVLKTVDDEQKAKWQKGSKEELDSKMPELQRISSTIDKFLSGTIYARESSRNILESCSRKAFRYISGTNWESNVNIDQHRTIQNILRFINESKSLARNSNELFVKSELALYRKFFDEIEQKPLTLAQRQACVINEDSNLVLAGAGTGKTSTMIARAGYLIASKNATADRILMLAFANKAAREMQKRSGDRLSRWVKGTSPTVKTFHALGREIIGSVEGVCPELTPMAEDKLKYSKFLDTVIDRLCKNKSYARKLIEYCGGERYPYRNPFDFNSMPEYYEYIRGNELRTLNGDIVKSFEECIIANYLNAHSIRYIYEHPYVVKTSGPNYKQYKPDFYLCDYNIYIEHFAINGEGQPPIHFDQRKYLEGMEWKRNLHKKNKTVLIETYSYFKREGILELTLEKRLLDAGVALKRRSDDELLAELRASTEISFFSQLLSNYITLFKQSDKDLQSLRHEAEAHIDKTRILLLLELFSPAFDAYEAENRRNGQIDFADMIKKATRYVEMGSYKSPYTHVLVDEFQDVSSFRAKLIRELIKQRPGSVLFVVGDDWQAIYRFTGSDIGYTKSFESHFGAARVTSLDLTFRFNDKIGSVASQFILNNPEQIKKTINSTHCVSHPAVSLVRVVRSEDGLNMALSSISSKIKNEKKAHATVLVLARFRFVIKEWLSSRAMSCLKKQYPAVTIDFMTMHESKGKEADYVIILGLCRGSNGFPCEKATDAVIELLLPNREDYPHAEERRLFYVAVTRARHRVYLIYDPMDASQFIAELCDPKNGYTVTDDEFRGSLVSKPTVQLSCPSCKSGYLVPKDGPHGRFIACNNYPRCQYSEQPCPQCGGIMRRGPHTRTCTNPKCFVVMPTCRRCDGYMVERNGPNGKFWGCVNYRSSGDYICRYTISIQ